MRAIHSSILNRHDILLIKTRHNIDRLIKLKMVPLSYMYLGVLRALKVSKEVTPCERPYKVTNVSGFDMNIVA